MRDFRGKKRVDIIVDIEIYQDGETYKTQTLDISENGLLAVQDYGILKRGVISIKINNNIFIDKAEITYNHGNYFGVKFINIADEEFKKLKKIL